MNNLAKNNTGIQEFYSGRFGQIRVKMIEGKPWFVGRDVAEVLGYKRATKAIQDHVNERDKDRIKTLDTIGRKYSTPIINEEGLYSLVANSRMPTAKKILTNIEDWGVYKKIRKQTQFEELLKNALEVYNKETGMEVKFEPEVVTESGYRLDIYFPTEKLIVEYDEEHHKYQKEEDLKREDELKQLFEGVKFIRVNKGEEQSGVIRVLANLGKDVKGGSNND